MPTGRNKTRWLTADYSPLSTVIVCRCGWRFVAVDRAHAWHTAGQHTQAEHNTRHEANAYMSRLASRSYAPTALETLASNRP